ncbi:hypothetical protein RHSIM_Rhsim09G0011000 [Rhododendron simsii]|uniref:Uncharacterized protein n=1 Tax=Rhododendron simsii TaxID=118357 RepID=A0A834LDP6_RHOSS|nr:hypothetical protein RHSIM_Rhsim09G0011000 [Rhododendron simsii]
MEDDQFHFSHDQEAILAAMLQQHQISDGGGSCPAAAAAKSSLLQQQLLFQPRGVAVGVSGGSNQSVCTKRSKCLIRE